jgi:hypothetical protein
VEKEGIIMTLLKWLRALALALGAALAVSYLWFGVEHQTDSQFNIVQQKCSPTISEQLEEVVEDRRVTFRISYNDLTDNHSKTTYHKGSEIFYLLEGTADNAATNARVRCLVTKEFYDSTQENSIVSVPVEKCEEVKP